MLSQCQPFLKRVRLFQTEANLAQALSSRVLICRLNLPFLMRFLWGCRHIDSGLGWLIGCGGFVNITASIWEGFRRLRLN